MDILYITFFIILFNGYYFQVTAIDEVLQVEESYTWVSIKWSKTDGNDSSYVVNCFSIEYTFNDTFGNLTDLSPGQIYNCSIKAMNSESDAFFFTVQTVLSPPSSAMQVNLNETGSNFIYLRLNASMTANLSSYFIKCKAENSAYTVSFNVSSEKNISFVKMYEFLPTSVYNCSVVSQKYGFNDSIPIFFSAQTAPSCIVQLVLNSVDLDFFLVNISPCAENNNTHIEFVIENLSSNSVENRFQLANETIFKYSAISGLKYRISARFIFEKNAVRTYGNFSEWLQVFMPLCPIPADSIQVRSDPAFEDTFFVSWNASNVTGVLYLLRCTSQSSCNTFNSNYTLENIMTTSGNCSGLSPGVKYNISVVAMMAGHKKSEPVTTFNSTYPSVVMNVTKLYSGSTFVFLSWEKQANSCVDYYNIFSTSRNINFTNISTNEANITDLKPYQTYEVQIQASSNQLLGRSFFINITTSEGLPSEPLAVQIKNATNSSVLLFWKIPDETRGQIVDYFVSYQDLVHNVNPVSGSHSGNQTSNTTQIWITGLIPGTEYEFKVRARTSAGFGPYSKAVFGYTIANLPFRPTGLLLISNQRNMSVFWQPPSVHVGVEFEYLLRVTEENRCVQLHIYECSDCRVSRDNVTDIDSLLEQISTQCDSVNATMHPNAFQAKMNVTSDISELEPGLDYTVSVFAINVQGVGPDLTSSVRTLDSEPSAPLNLTVKSVDTNTSLLVEWREPSKTNGRITNYRITHYTDFYVNKTFTEVSGNKTSETLSGLIPGVCYNVIVTGKTSAGYGSDSNVSRQFTNDVEPNAPAHLIVSSTKSSLNVSWSPPLADPNSAPPFMYLLKLYKHKKCVSFVQFVCKIGNCTFSQNDMTTERKLNLTSKIAELNSNCSANTNESFSYSQNGLRWTFDQLESGRKFSFFIWAVNRWGVGANSSLTNIPTDDDKNTGKPINPSKRLEFLFALSGFIIVIIIAVLLFLFFHKRLQSRNSEPIPSEINLINPRDVSLFEFNDYVHLMQSDAGLLNEGQFDLIVRLSTENEQRNNFAAVAAKDQKNLQKNRFTNVLPFDHSRVRLLTEDDSVDSVNKDCKEIMSFYSGTDYINANYIMGHHSQREFIACQGPLQSTIDDMWRLIWEQNIRCIVMLTQLRESQRQKCERYWPLEVDEIECHGLDGLSVRLVSESTLSCYTVRVLEVCLAREQRVVTQLHYLKWEDFKAPDLTEFWEFLRDFRNHVPHDIDAPILVHCSAGVGRTGTFIVLDWILHSLRAGATTINVPTRILQMRTQRRYMVQNFRQLDFIYKFLNWYLEHEMCVGTGHNDLVHQSVV